MAEHTIETRILLRYDTYEHWSQSTIILKPGEAAIAVFDARVIDDLSNTTPLNTPPAVGIKIGDGRHYFYELPWVQGVAADVYKWAKSSTKPTYTANEITGLQSFIEENFHISGDVTFTPRIYQIVQGTGENENKYYLRYKENNDASNWIIDYNNPIDLSAYATIANWIGNLTEQFPNIGTFTATQTRRLFEGLSYNDTAQNNKFVTSVSENSGIISVERAQPSFSNLSGQASVSQGGTGLTSLTDNNVLVGNGTSNVKLIPIAESIAANNHLVPNYLIKNYVDNATAGLTGAMHFIGEATVTITNNSSVNPRITGYNFSQAQPGDVILGSNKEEFVWTGSIWRLLGDEGSYAVKGSITNVDIAEEANIDQSKINNLSADLSGKVDKIDGKSLTSNDFTDEYKQKLDNIEEYAQRNLIEHIYINGTEAIPTVIEGKNNSLAIRLSSLTPEEEEKLRGIESGAQVNAIEHIFLNDDELPITTVKTLNKSVQLELIEYTEQEKQKLASIENGAQVNTIQGITVNGFPVSPSQQDKIIEITIPSHADHINKIEEIQLNGVKINPNQDKQVNIVIDENAVQFRVLAGARVPTGIQNAPYEDVAIDENTKKLELARIAATGRIYDIQNTAVADTTDYLILRCGDASTLI